MPLKNVARRDLLQLAKEEGTPRRHVNTRLVRTRGPPLPYSLVPVSRRRRIKKKIRPGPRFDARRENTDERCPLVLALCGPIFETRPLYIDTVHILQAR